MSDEDDIDDDDDFNDEYDDNYYEDYYEVTLVVGNAIMKVTRKQSFGFGRRIYSCHIHHFIIAIFFFTNSSARFINKAEDFSLSHSSYHH